jgi:hypothetical protein
MSLCETLFSTWLPVPRKVRQLHSRLLPERILVSERTGVEGRMPGGSNRSFRTQSRVSARTHGT